MIYVRCPYNAGVDTKWCDYIALRLVVCQIGMFIMEITGNIEHRTRTEDFVRTDIDKIWV